MRTLSLPMTRELSVLRTHRLRRWVVRLSIWLVGILWIGLASTLCGCGVMHGSASNLVGQNRFRRANFAAARGSFERAVADDPFNANYAYNLARTMQKQGDLQGAEKMYQHAMTLDPAHRLAYRDLGNMLVAQGRQGEALLMMQAWAETQPYSAPAHIELAAIQRKTGDVAGAERSMQQAQQIQSRQLATYNRPGTPYRQTVHQQAMRPTQQPSGAMQLAEMQPATAPTMAGSPYMPTAYSTQGGYTQTFAGSFPATEAGPHMSGPMPSGMNPPSMQGTMQGGVTYSTSSPGMMQGHPGTAMPYPANPLPGQTIPMTTASGFPAASFPSGPVSGETFAGGNFGAVPPDPAIMTPYGTNFPVQQGGPMPMTTVTPGGNPPATPGYAPTLATTPAPVVVGEIPSTPAF